MTDDLFLRVLYRGLFQELLSDSAVENSLKLFLPYAVSYPDRNPLQPVIKLIDPHEIETSLGDESVSNRFFANKRNETVIKRAKSVGRSDCLLWQIIVDFNRKADQAIVQEDSRIVIVDSARGDKTYRRIAQEGKRSRANGGAVGSDEYDIQEFGWLFPTLAIFTQEDHCVLGAVSIDCSHNLDYAIARIIHAFTREYNFLNAWQFSRLSLREFYCKAPGRWPTVGQASQDFYNTNPFLAIANHDYCSTNWSRLLESVKSILHTELDAAEVKRVESAIDNLPEDWAKHSLFKALFGHEKLCLPLWSLLSESDAGRYNLAAPFLIDRKLLQFWSQVKRETLCVFSLAVASIVQRDSFDVTAIEFSQDPPGPSKLIITAKPTNWSSLSAGLTQKVQNHQSEIGSLAPSPIFAPKLAKSLALLTAATTSAWEEASDYSEMCPKRMEFRHFVLPVEASDTFYRGFPVVLLSHDDTPYADPHTVMVRIIVQCPADTVEVPNSGG